jgi:hypothetical protein
MVKNSSTIDRGTKVRFGRWHNDDQADNTIVINASDTPIQVDQPNALYMKPVRVNEGAVVTLMGIDPFTNEITDTNINAQGVQGREVDFYANIGNTLTSTILFTGDRSFTTTGTVGISNTDPIHTLDVGSKFYVEENGANVLTVLGDTYLQDDVVIGGSLNVIGTVTAIDTVNTTVKDAIIEIGKGNVSSDMGIIMDRPGTNVTLGYREVVDEFVIAYTDSSATSSAVVPSSELIDVRVHGRLHTNSNLTVDTNTFHVDAISGHVGIHTVTPQTDLDVVGAVAISSNLSVDTNTLHVDTTTDRVGINTLTPSTDFHVEGETYVSGNVTVDIDTFHVDTVNDRVGINTLTPTTDFHVEGETYISGNVTVDTNTLHVDTVNTRVGINTLNPTTDFHVEGLTYISSNLTVDTDTFHVDATTDRVGINTLNPQTDFDVVGKVAISSDLSVNTNTLHVDASSSRVGINTLTPSTDFHVEGETYVSGNVTVDIDTFHVDTVNDRVGINTLTPTTDFHVEGDTYVSGNVDVQTDLTVTGNAYMSSNIIVTGNADVLTDLNVTGNGFMQTDLTVTGNAYMSSNIVITGNADVQTDLNVTGNAYMLSNVVVAGNADVQTDLNVMGNAYMLSNVVVTGNVDVHSELNVTGNVRVDSNIMVTDTTTSTSKTSGAVQITGGLGVQGDIYATNVNFETAEVDHLNVTDTTISTSQSTGAAIILGGLGVAGNVYAENFYGGDISVTNVNTTSNINIGDAISIASLTQNKIPFIGDGKYLKDSHIAHSVDSTIITSDLEVLGNVIVNGNSYTIESETLVINDRVIGLANNNTSHLLDVGIIMQHPGKNIGLIHHGAATENDPHDHTFTIGYTQNSITDNHILDDSNLITVEILGNLITQNNLTVSDNITVNGQSTFHGQSTFSDDLTVGAASNLFVDVSTSRVGINEPTPSASLDVGGDVNVQSVVDSTSKTTGSLKVAGGVGIIGSVFAESGDFNSLVTTSNVATINLTASDTIHTTNINISDTVTTTNISTVNITSSDTIHTTNVATTNLTASDTIHTTNLNIIDTITTTNVATTNVTASDTIHTGNLIASDTVKVTNGIITNLGGLTKKTYGYSSGIITASTTPEINVVFANQMFSAKITAHLVEPTSNISVLNLDVTGGTGRNIGKGFLSIVGDQNSKHWDSVIATTDTTVTLTPSVGLLGDGTYGIFVEYTSPLGGGGVTGIDKDNTNEITFDY